MTLEEAREVINREIDKAIDDETYMTDEIYDALCVASKSIALQILESQPCEDAISREDAINALRKALYDYEDKTEKQFKESKELNFEDWFQHRIFVQNMNDIDIQTILELPPVTPQPKTGHWIYDGDCIICNKCLKAFGWISMNMASDFCPNCGADMRGEEA